MFTLLFWKASFERAVKSAAQGAVTAIGVNVTGVLELDAVAVASAAGLMFLLSILTSIGSGFVTSDGGPSLTGEVLADDALAHRHRDV